MNRIVNIEKAIAKIPDNKKAWEDVCDILMDSYDSETIFENESRTIQKGIAGTEEYLKNVYPSAIRLADVIHTMQTVPVYIIMRTMEDGTYMPAMVENEGEDEGCVLASFSKEDAETISCEIDSEGTILRIARVPFFILIDGLFGYFPDIINPSIALCDMRENGDEKSSWPIVTREDVMSLLLDATKTLRYDYAYDVYSMMKTSMENDTQPVETVPLTQQEPLFPFRVLNGSKKPPVS